MRIVRFSPCLSGFSFAILAFTFGFVLLGAFPSSFRGGGLLGLNTNEQFKFERKVPSKGPGYPPIFAYWISGSKGEKDKILRLLKAVYHPRNRYLLHLDAGSSHRERSKLAASVQSERVFRAFGNVDVVGQVHSFDRRGSSAIAVTLRAAAMLLRINGDWDWFITLSASDYPIVTPDDFLHVFTPLPRNLNFVRLTSYTGWKESQRINQIVIDPNLYMSANTPIFQVKETRPTPEAFKVLTGSPWVILSRPFIEYCVHGGDNLPRKLLIYFSNAALPLETYFHTILCNSPDFQNTTVNSDLRYVVWDTPPKLDPQFLHLSHYEEMVTSGAAFAGRFKEDDPMLLKMDEDILGRRRDGVAPGKWCLGPSVNKSVKSLEEESCLFWGDNIDVAEPGDHVEKLRSLVSKLVAEGLDVNKCNL